jgi:pyruvate dehydrogenase E1 component alpha subunit
VRVDGNDVFAVLAVARQALERAREGSGPTLIEAFTYRMGAHTTTDDPTRYRLAGELETWKLKDPLERVKAYLSRGGKAGADFFAEVEADADKLAVHLRESCLAMPDPQPLTMFDHVYAEPSPLLVQQRDEFGDYLASFEGSSA